MMTAPLVRTAGTNDGATIRRAVLALKPRAMHVAGRHRDRVPSVCRPARIINWWGVIATGNFTPNGPIEAGDGKGVILHA